MSHADLHPSLGALSGFALGTLSDEDQLSIERHLATCSQCLEKAANVETCDAFTQLLLTASSAAHLAGQRGQPADADTGATMFDATIAGLGHRVPPPPAGRDDADSLPLAGHPRYRVARLLGRGGMGSVWLAEHLLMGRPVAIKVIRPELVQHPEALERFRREVQAAAKLHHPNIAAAYDAEQFGAVHFLVMEYISGQLLAERVAASPLPPAEACRIASDAAQGLAHAHAAGLIHRDIKPGNLIISDAGVVKILDFGLVTLPHVDSQITGADIVMGTVDYIAPEQAEDPRRADERSDIYSLGCTLFELLSGKPPFSGTPLQKLDARRRQRPPRLDGVTPALQAIVARMMATVPADRYQTANEVVRALAPFCQSGDTASRESRTRTALNRRSILALVTSLAVALASVGAYSIATDKGEIRFEVDSESARVVIKRDDRLITVVHPHESPHVRLRTGEYDLTLEATDKSLILNVDEVTVERGKTSIVRIERGHDVVPDAPGTKEAATILPERIIKAGAGLISDVVFSHDSRTVIACSPDDRRVRSWNVQTGAVEQEYRVADDTIVAVALADQGRTLAGGGQAGIVHLWSVDGRQQQPLVREPLPPGDGRIICRIRTSPDGQRIAVASQSGEVAIWDLPRRELLAVLPGPHGPTYSVTWASDGGRVAYGNDPLLYLTHVDGAAQARTARNPSHWSDEAFSPDGRSLAAATWGGWIHLFDAETLAIQRKFPVEAMAPHFCRYVVYVTNEIVVTSGVTTDMRAWDVSGPKERFLATFDGHVGLIQRLTLSLDKRRLVTSSESGEIAIWNLPGEWADVGSGTRGMP